MFYASRLINTGASSFFIDSVFSLDGFAGGRPAASHFLLLRQKKVTKEKATRSLSPYASLRARCGARSKWGQSQTRFAQTSACPDPLCPALLTSARTGLQINAGADSDFPDSEFISHPVLAGLEIFGRDGLKNLDVRRLRSRLVSRFSVSAKYFKGPQSGPDCGSPFFSLGFFGEAKKSKSPAGASPGMPARGNLLRSRLNLRDK